MNKEVFFSLNDCQFSFGKKKLFKNLSFTIHENDRVALVGKNGVGKSTLLKIISSKSSIDSGDFFLNPKITIGYLTQKENILVDEKIFNFLKKFVSKDSFLNDHKIYNICKIMKLNPDDNINTLSGGMRRKLNLASIIVNESKLLLLDEPTNHLDIESIKWLEEYLVKDFKGAFVIISHNRSFLKNVTNKVFWMDRGIIKVSPKGFYNFENWSNELIEQEKRELHNKEKFLVNETEWLSKGVTARRKRNIRRKKNIEEFKSNLKKDRSEFLKSVAKTRILTDDKEFDSPNILINFFNVEKKFTNNLNEKIILKNFNFKLTRGQKIGIIGKNGCGKSTFLNLVAKKENIDKGNIKIRNNIKFSFFDQSGKQFDDKKTIKENLISGGGDYIDVLDRKEHICGYLKKFLFDPKSIDMPVGLLSGGERNRLLLAKILASPREILLLDEPTNDLDIETIDVLIDFLNKFKGGVFVASHDLDFLERTVDNFFIMDGSGNINSSLVIPKKLEDSSTQKPSVKLEANQLDKKKKIKTSKELDNKKRIIKILKKIELKEKVSRDLSKRLEDENFTFKNSRLLYNEVIDKINDNQKELLKLEKEWIELEEISLNEDNS